NRRTQPSTYPVPTRRSSSSRHIDTGSGHLVLGNAGPIAIPPADRIEIGSDGTISIVPAGQDPNTLVVIDRIRLVRADNAQLVKGNDGLFRQKDGAPAEPDAGIQLTSGVLEGSNVNMVDALVKIDRKSVV